MHSRYLIRIIKYFLKNLFKLKKLNYYMSESDLVDECIFCFEELDKYDIAVLNCPHKYHVNCIRSWNNKSKKYNIVCPQCNSSGEIVNIIPGKVAEPVKPKNTTQPPLSLPPPPLRSGYRHINQLPINVTSPSSRNLPPPPPYSPYRNTRVYAIEPDRRNTITYINDSSERRRRHEIYEEVEQPYICCNIL